ncbi:S8 family serine peptidase [Clostridium sp. SHJSY1]|uniref:S8 family peptidase n=1 Tax=Clostridium sp. SHJSY1 TaxID=2942483 RepID=UPI002874AEA0|nr:S8 family peptidase [Clostridium sp. SHJSY1]MDS0525365.1 S8 family serine peptidase [Clostridium sp. SHJSY1]
MENGIKTTNLIKNVPESILSKLNFTSNLSQMDENIEVIVLYGEKFKDVNEYITSIGAKLQDLGYGYGIVTINRKDIEKLAQNPDLQYIELPASLYFSDLGSNRAACIDKAQNDYGIYGEGIIIGFVDSGIDFTHPAFKNEDGTTRIEYIYDLSLGGQIYDKNLINQALKSSDPASIVPSYDVIEHGTHVAGIACAGGKIDPRNYGVAPKSSIMMVKSARGNFSLSTQLMRGLKFLVDKANELKKPLVVNLSLSTNDGAHKGTSLLEQYINTLVSSERITVVVAAGNEGSASHHIGGALEIENVIKFNVAEDETAVVINLYKSVLSQVSLELITPTGTTTGAMVIEEGYKEGVISRNRYQIYNTGPRPFDINGEIGISLITKGNYILSGEWTIKLRLLNEYKGIYDMWLPIAEGLNEKTKFLSPTINNTLGIPATVNTVISVGSYNYITRMISPFSGRGVLRLYGETKPDVVAPGEGITAPIPNGSYDAKTGTSMASPHVAGICALMMEWGIIKGNDPFLYGSRLKYYLIMGARRGRRDTVYPDTSWGYGEVCIKSSIDILIDTLNIISTNAPRYKYENRISNEYMIGELFVRYPKK